MGKTMCMLVHVAGLRAFWRKSAGTPRTCSIMDVGWSIPVAGLADLSRLGTFSLRTRTDSLAGLRRLGRRLGLFYIHYNTFETNACKRLVKV